MRAIPSALLVCVLLVSGCSQPEPESSPTPQLELAEPATVVPASPDPASEASVAPASSEPASHATPPPNPVGTATTEERPPTEPTVEPSPAAPPSVTLREVAVIDDASGDAGVEAPAYADIRRIALLEDGQDVSVVVELGAPPPSRLAQGEVIGIGVDLDLDHRGESEYQLFIDGGSDGWRAYLQTPEGFVDYPGSFVIRGVELRLRIGWNHVGSPTSGRVSGFLDWSEQRLLLNAAAHDRAPDRGTVAFSR